VINLEAAKSIGLTIPRSMLFLGGAPSSGKACYVNRAFVSPMLSKRRKEEK